jgi:hypothetical protein
MPFFTRSALFASSLCTTVESRGSSTATMCRTSWWYPLSAICVRRGGPGMPQGGCPRGRAVAEGEDGRGHAGDPGQRAESLVDRSVQRSAMVRAGVSARSWRWCSNNLKEQIPRATSPRLANRGRQPAHGITESLGKGLIPAFNVRTAHSQ